MARLVCAASAMIRPVIGLLLGLALVVLLVDVGPRWQTASVAWAARTIPALGTVTGYAAHKGGAPPVSVPQPSPRTENSDEAIAASGAATALTHTLDSTPPVQLQAEAPASGCCLVATGTTLPRRIEVRLFASRAPPGSSPTSQLTSHP